MLQKRKNCLKRFSPCLTRTGSEKFNETLIAPWLEIIRKKTNPIYAWKIGLLCNSACGANRHKPAHGEKNLSLMKNAVSCLLTSCICLSCEFVSLSHSVHPMCSVSYPLSHHVSHVTLVSEICLILSLMLVWVLSPIWLVSASYFLSHVLVSCLSNLAMNLLVSYVLKIVSYLTWTALG